MESVDSASEVGRPVTLTSQGNHPPADWGLGTAQVIFDVSVLEPPRLLAAIELQRKVGQALAKYYHAVIQREIEHLTTYVDQCDATYDVSDLAKKATAEIQLIAEGSLWQELVHFAEWSSAAYDTIANHLASAAHVERLLFADVNPTNSSAVAYKARFNGISP